MTICPCRGGARFLGVFLLTVLPATRGDEPPRPTASASSSNPAVPAPGHSLHGESFDDGPRHAATLLAGMGRIRFPVTTARPAAQAFVNQGVAQLHSFLYLEAERSFRQAARIDPGCAMAYWGMAMANVNNAKRTRGFLKEASKRSGSLSRRESLYLDALGALYHDGQDEKTRKQNHLLGLETIVQEFPDDLDARAWLAMVTWQSGTVGSRQAVDTLLDSVLQVDPTHPGAHHYRIHLWDGVKPLRAERSAEVYGSTAPGIAHAWHMPGHTYTGLKRYHEAAYQQEASARVDHAYMIRERVMPFEIHNYAHNNQWLVTTYSHIGRVRDGVAVARNLVEQPRDPKRNGRNDGGSPQRSGRIRWAELLARYELWEDLIAATTSGALDWSTIDLEQRQKAYYLGLAYAGKEDLTRLSEQIDVMKALQKKDRGASASLAELEGWRFLGRKEFDAAFKQFKKAGGMPAERLARGHLAAGQKDQAVTAARQAVAGGAGQVPPLAVLVEALQSLGKTDEARVEYARLAPLLRDADPDLPVMRRLATLARAWASDGWVAPRLPAPAQPAPSVRPALATLGPLTWSPSPAEQLSLADTGGHAWSLGDHRGRNVVILFYLGGKCPHCMQQLTVFGQEYEKLRAQGTDVVAVSTDDAEATRALKENREGVKFPMPLLADPKLETFRRYHAYDDFEDQPLHGTFLVNRAGNVRYQRISAEPFLDVDFIKAEAARVDRLSGKDAR